MEGSGPAAPNADAEAAFASFLARVGKGERVDFDVFCLERPLLSGPLRDLHAAWRSQRPPSKPGERLSLREVLDRRPGVELDPEAPRDPPSSGVRERLQHLATRSDRYELRGEVARGGMGVVLKVWDKDLRRTLAMKAAFAGVPDEKDPVSLAQVTRFLEEAQITGQLDHPGVVPVHELGVDEEGRVFFTMRLIRGQTLDEVIRLARADEDGWNRARALDVMVRVCEAMAYAHSKGVIHRDIKPANVMVGKFGEVYVMDWGLAKVIGRPDPHGKRLNESVALLRTQVRTDRAEDISRTPNSPYLTLEGTIVGTPPYMPPEQAEGRIDALDPRSDVYSVGALLYTLLTGRMPYVEPGQRAAAGDVISRLLEGPPPAVHSIDSTAPAELVAICEKAMARRREERYADMVGMAEDLRAYVEGRVVRAYRTGALAEFQKWVVRNKATAAAVAALLLVALGGSVFAAWQQREKVTQVTEAQALEEQARTLAEQHAREALGSAEAARASAERAERQSYLANLAAAHASLRMHETREAKQLLASCPERYRGFEWLYLRLSADTSVRTIDAHRGKVTAVALSRDGTRIASGGDDRTVRLWNAADGSPVLSLPGAPDVVTSLAFAPDGRLAAGSKDTLVRVWDIEAGRLLGTMTHDGLVGCVAFDAAGERLATATDDGVRVWQARDFSRLFDLAHEEPVHAVVFGPDGTYIATATDEGVHVWNLEHREQPRTITLPEGATCLAAAAGRLAAGSNDSTVSFLDPVEGEVLAVLRGHEDPVSGLTFTPDGKYLVTASYDKTVRVWDVAELRPIAVFQGHDEAALAVDCGANGVVVSGGADGTLRLWSTETGGTVSTLRGDDDALSAVAFDPTGETVAACSAGHGEIRIWDARTGRPVRYIKEAGGLSSLAFSPDGKRIAAGGEEDATGRIHDYATGDLLHRLEGHTSSVSAVAFSPDGAQVATGSADKTIRLWDAAKGSTLAVLEAPERVNAIAFTADGGRLLAAYQDGSAAIWDVARKVVATRIAGHDGKMLCAAFDPEGRWVATGGTDHMIRFWDQGTGAEGPVLAGHAGAVGALAFAPGGRLLSGGHDKTLRVWDVATGDQLLRLLAHDNWVTGVAVTADGSRVATCSFDATARIWRAGTDGR